MSEGVAFSIASGWFVGAHGGIGAMVLVLGLVGPITPGPHRMALGGCGGGWVPSEANGVRFACGVG